ncbi:hypothetical protein [Xenorhabdus sp. SGI240]|uniref:hypothetical protein n=1 Tax=Xenorhabdus sp. SGI240 TaxID=3158262 RepID=UPI0032B79022
MNNINNKKQRYGFFVTLFLYGVSLISMYFGNVWVAFGIIYLGSFISLMPEWNSIKYILSKYFKKFYQLIILSTSYIISIKWLNYELKVEKDYLTYSPWIISIIFQFFLLLAFIIVWVIFSPLINWLIGFFSNFLPFHWIENINNNSFVKLSNKSMCILVIILPLTIPVAYISDPLLNIALRIDAYATSDCGGTKTNTAYLRKNNKACYKFYPYFSFVNPSVIPSEKGK